jgi:arginine/serine-rich splicing factor 4/5/6
MFKVDLKSKDAEDALYHFNGKSFMGQKYGPILPPLSLTEYKSKFYSIVVEFAKESRPRREPYEDRYGYSKIISREISGDVLIVF